METKNDLQAAHIEKKSKASYTQLHNNYLPEKNENVTLQTMLGTEKVNLSQNALEMALLLVNGLPNLREANSTAYYWMHEESVTNLSKRYQAFNEKYANETFWTAEYRGVLDFFYGKERTNYVIDVWNNLHQLMYQKGYERRAFRAPNRFHSTRLNQLNFLIRLNAELSYDLDMESYIIYDYALNRSSYWTPHLWAAAIDAGNTDVFQLLLDIVYQRHPIGKVSSGIIKALLLSNNPKGWEAVKDLLLSAQRQEGLRQTILECLDETSLGAMKYMMKVILEHNLTRFSSVVRAIDTWTGLGYESAKQSTIKRFLDLGYTYLTAPELIPNAVKEKDNAVVYMALWAQGVLNVEECAPLINDLYKRGGVEKRCLALYFANQTKLASLELELAKKALEEENLKIFYWGLNALNAYTFKAAYFEASGQKMFDLITRQLDRIPKKGQQFSSLIFSWMTIEISPEMAHRALLQLTNKKKEEDLKRILPYLPAMAVDQRQTIVQLILPAHYPYSYNQESLSKELNTFQRSFAFSILTDRAEVIRTTGMNALADASLNDEEVQQFEGLLKRKNAETRKSVIQLILKKENSQIIASVERLLASRSIDQRLAGLDIVNQVYQNAELQNWAKETATVYSQRTKLIEAEVILLKNSMLETAAQQYTWENGLGLYNPKEKSPTVSPIPLTSGEYVERKKGKNLSSNETVFGLSMSIQEIDKNLNDLHALVKEHEGYEYEVINWGGHKEMVVLGNSFRQISSILPVDAPKNERIQNYPLVEVWLDWYKASKLTSCDLFLMQLNRGGSHYYGNTEGEKTKTAKIFDRYIYHPNIPKIGNYDWQNPIYTILELLVYAFPYEKKEAFLKGLVTELMAAVPKEEIGKAIVDTSNRWNTYVSTWRDLPAFARPYEQYASNSLAMSDEDFEAYWQLEHWCKSNLPVEVAKDDYRLSKLVDVARAYELKLISKDALQHRILKPDAISLLTKKTVRKNEFNYFERFPFLEEIVTVSRARILEIELLRGDSSTLVTPLAQSLTAIYGSQNFVQIFKALGKENLNRGYVWSRSDYSKKQILSELLKVCFPLKTDTQADFNRLVKAAKLSDKRLIEAAVYAQQWIPFVSTYLNWKGLDSAIWWLHAHASAQHTAETETEIAKYSKIALLDFQDGAVDTDWFRSAYKCMGKAKWKVLYDAAKYISDGRGHKRAQLYADVILGRTKITVVTKRVKEKRNQDYLRVYGLIPLSKTVREKDLLKRYQYLQQFKKESKQFGSQRQTSEGLAMRIAMDNLARTAGYSDPIRLTWAMEAQEAKQIMNAAQKLRFGAVEIYLSINNLGKSSIVCQKEGKVLTAIPAKLRKEKAVVELKKFHKTLKNQYSRTRKSLEDAMVNGDCFTKAEILNLLEHPIVQPMLTSLLLKTNDRIGFATTEGLKNADGIVFEMGEMVQIAHCWDVYQTDNWSAYQRYCFEHKVVQPFKQIFRELYLPTVDELKEQTISRRYAGHQVQPKKTVALLKTRGWTVDYEEGLQKVYHKEGLIAKMYAMADWFSPADVESPTLETIQFFTRKEHKPIPFDQLNPSIFSEIMRDIDLVVSVAHVGGVDPEASHSTIEMRAVIVKETTRLFKIENTDIRKHHVYIDGTLGRYTVHLGSAVCHKVPGRYLSILSVNSQHRGRIFLPFVDDDPRSAEVMSKVLLLAKDHKIQDPTILDQIMDKVALI